VRRAVNLCPWSLLLTHAAHRRRSSPSPIPSSPYRRCRPAGRSSRSSCRPARPASRPRRPPSGSMRAHAALVHAHCTPTTMHRPLFPQHPELDRDLVFCIPAQGCNDVRHTSSLSLRVSYSPLATCPASPSSTCDAYSRDP
jgi:hypothetical protein